MEDGSLKKINVEELMEHFNGCIREDGSVDIDKYLIGFNTVYRFFCLMGKVFGFVASDIIAKIKILEEFRQSPEGHNYETIQSMTKYEKTLNYKLENSAPTGCRTLLRLHRALDFVMEFLSSVLELKDEEKVVGAAQEAYKKTISKYHPWIIRKAAVVAMYALPTAKDLVTTTCCQSVNEVRVLLPKVIEHARNTHNITQKVYKEYDILNLP